jgi:hypothetical protein
MKHLLVVAIVAYFAWQFYGTWCKNKKRGTVHDAGDYIIANQERL